MAFPILRMVQCLVQSPMLVPFPALRGETSLAQQGKGSNRVISGTYYTRDFLYGKTPFRRGF